MGGKNATADEKRQRREIVKKFMNEAKVGNVYTFGVGLGSTNNNNTFEIVDYNRSSNKMGIRDSRHRTIALTNQNAAEYIKNGATLIKKKNR